MSMLTGVLAVNSSQLNPLSPPFFFLFFGGRAVPSVPARAVRVPGCPPPHAGNRRPAIWGNKDINLASPLNKRVWLGPTAGELAPNGPFQPLRRWLFEGIPLFCRPS